MTSQIKKLLLVNGKNALRDFEKPPVNETVLSIQFAPLLNFGLPHYGLFWENIRSEFVQFQVHPSLPSITEQFDSKSRIVQRFGIHVSTQPEVRCWFLDKTGTRLIQLQKDRFIHNWRQISGEEPYPRYPSVKKTLEENWILFCDFLKKERISPPQVNQCEVTYVNHIEYNKGWNGYEELNKVIAPWSGKFSGDFLPIPERINMDAHFCLPDNLGRLHASLMPVIRGRDTQEVLQLTMTARGAPKSSSVEDVFQWLDMGREWVVKGFVDFTNNSMHEIWGRKS